MSVHPLLTDAQHVIIVGLGREGWSSIEYIQQQFPDKQFIIIDDAPLDQLADHWQTLIEESHSVQFVTSQQAQTTNSLLRQHASTSLAVLSPGIPPRHPIRQLLQELEIETTSNTTLLFELVSEYNHTHSVPASIQTLPVLTIIGITGTKGKSTTTASIAHLLETAGVPFVLGGNIGKAPLAVWKEAKQVLKKNQQQRCYLVLELSAHQLQNLAYSPHIAVVLNITPEHLDYYSNFEEYVQAKSAIVSHQSSADFAIYSPEHANIAELILAARSQKLCYSHSSTEAAQNHCQFHCDESGLFAHGTRILSSTEVFVPGVHNLENLLPSVIIAELLGIPTEIIKSALTSFKGLPHRLHKVAEYTNIRFYDDSLSTTPVATAAALDTFPDDELFLIAGGHERNLDYTELGQKIVARGVHSVILFPKTGERIAAAIIAAASATNLPAPHLYHVLNMHEALTVIHSHAKPGAVVLLSPASPSFGQFKDYRERGHAFAQAIQEVYG